MPIPPTGLSLARIEAAASLPVGWQVSGVVQYPDESWRAWAQPGPVAATPQAPPIEGHGKSAEQALLNLARNARATAGGPGVG